MFDKAQCINNIYTLAKKKGLKIGELEEKAGVSKGYLSRINREDSTANPPVDFLVSVAEQLDVSMDYLLAYAENSFTENEMFILEFIEKLTCTTIHKELDWVLQSRNALTAENDNPVDNPLIDIMPNYSSQFDTDYNEHVFTSQFYSKGRSIIIGDCYYCHIPMSANSRVYLMNVRYFGFTGDEQYPTLEENLMDAFELYICSKKDINPLCSTAYIKEEISCAVKKLYNTINTTSSRISISSGAKTAMQNFMNN